MLILMLVLKFLHIAVMFTAVAISTGPELVLRGVARSGDVRAIRAGYAIADRIGKAIPPAFFIGMILGLLTAWAGGFNFLAPWLLIAYVLFVVATILGARFASPHIAHVAALAVQSPDEAPSAELATALADRGANVIFVVESLIIIAFVFDMVLKPFS
jgi:hypothetical protein